jgi:ComF family protein
MIRSCNLKKNKKDDLIKHVKIWRDFIFKEFVHSRTCKKLCLYILDSFFPIECLCCKTEGDFICAKCQKKIFIKRIQTCPNCHRPSQFGKFCNSCQAQKNFQGVLAMSDYKDRLTEMLIKKYKYNFLKGLSQNFASILSGFFNQEAISDNKIFSKYLYNEILIIPVPLHRKRLNWRGFNQSEELARKFAANYNFCFDQKNLLKKIHTQPQAKLKGNERLENLKNCFDWQGEKITHKCVILIDDVATTCSTLNECALALKKAGAKNIWALVLANG